MQNKLQELTDRLYAEGLSKGKQEGEELVQKAKAEAEEIVNQAKAEAARIVADAQKSADELKEKTEADIRMAGAQSVDGIVTKSGAANSTDFYFPTGSNGNLGKVEVSNDASNVSVQYFSNPDGFGTNDLPRWWNAADMSGENPFNHVSNVEYWRISSTEAITADFVAEASTDMHFNSETDEEDRNPANIQMAFYDNNRWTNVGGSASIDGNTLSINGAEIPASATRGISGNYTTFGSKSKSTILPIELVSFTANCNGRSALIEWTTATEKNNDYFVLERSYDAVNFKEIARIAGAGNSIEPISYAYTDYGARSGDNYYRLVQVDYDGTSTASEIIVANCLGTDGEPEVLAYPNPFGDDLTLRFENFGNIQATVEVYDMLGRLVQTQKVNCSQNDYEVVLRLAGLSDGTYNVRISTADFVINCKVVKEFCPITHPIFVKDIKVFNILKDGMGDGVPKILPRIQPDPNSHARFLVL